MESQEKETLLRPDYPPTVKRAVQDVYHGQAVVDDYRWLEDHSDPEVVKWVEAQNAVTRAYIDGLDSRPLVLERLKELYSKTSFTYSSLKFRHGLLFFMKQEPPKQQRFLVTRRSADDAASEKIVFDPNDFDPTGESSIDWYEPSTDANLVAISISKHGSEDGSLHIFDLSGKKLPDVVLRVNFPTAGGGIAWNADSSGFYYTRYPHGGERPEEDMNFFQQVFFHKIGTQSDEDAYAIGKEFPRIAEVKLETTTEGRNFLATVANGDGGEFCHYYLGKSGGWVQISKFEDKITQASFGRDGEIYMLSRKESPRGKILHLPGSNPNPNLALTVAEAKEDAIEGFEITTTKLYVLETVGGPSEVYAYELGGKSLGKLPSEPVSSVNELVGLEGDGIMLEVESFLHPGEWHQYDAASGKTSSCMTLSTPKPVNTENFEVVRESATSNDGTHVPINIIRRKGLELNGRNSVLLTGYGGYGLSLKPYYRIRRTIWLELGGAVAVANLRGGNEFGEEWHESGKGIRKQNVFDDFLACATYLIKSGYTSPDRLVIEGGSNGGLLMGAVLTQRPDLFRAVVSHVGIYDMLRVELDPNGAFNITEFGTVKDPGQFRAIYAYSPYHRVVYGTKYPSVLLTTGENDGRVNPSNSRKMVAILQEASGSGLPVLLRTSSAGHGIGTALDETIAEDADVFSFLIEQLGLDCSMFNRTVP